MSDEERRPVRKRRRISLRSATLSPDDNIRALTSVTSRLDDELTALARRVQRCITELATIRDEMLVQTAIIRRLDNTVEDLRIEVRANHTLINRAIDRVRAVEARIDTVDGGPTPPPTEAPGLGE